MDPFTDSDSDDEQQVRRMYYSVLDNPEKNLQITLMRCT